MFTAHTNNFYQTGFKTWEEAWDYLDAITNPNETNKWVEDENNDFGASLDYDQ